MPTIFDGSIFDSDIFDATEPSYIAWADIQRSLDPADWGDGTPDVYLEIHGECASAAYPLFARLYNETLAAEIAASAIESDATTKTRARSAAFALTAGVNEYHVEFGGPQQAEGAGE